MSYLTDSEARLAEQSAHAKTKRELEKLQELCAKREKDFTPTTRLIMTMTAQVFGYILLHILGVSIFPSGQADIAPGLDFINLSAIHYLIISCVIPLVVGLHAVIQPKLEQTHVDIILLAYVVCDLAILLRLVCQQGGLCRSMFLPVFFLIPTAYIIVERRERRLLYRFRKVLVLMAIVACICTSYHMSVELMPLLGDDAGEPVVGRVHLLWWSKEVTDFSTLAHRHYDQALFVASMISAFVPIVQIGITMVQDRFDGDKAGTRPFIEN